MTKELSSNLAFEEAASQPAAASDALDKMKKMADEACELEGQISELEAMLEAMKKSAHHLKSKALPEAMFEAGLSEFVTDDGYRLAIETFLSGSLPKDVAKRDEAITWLEEHEAGDLIKNNLTITFEKRQHNEAMDLVNELHERGFDAAVKSDVHPQTLCAHVRERLKNGEEIPVEKLGLFSGVVVKIKKQEPKKPRSRKG